MQEIEGQTVTFPNSEPVHDLIVSIVATTKSTNFLLKQYFFFLCTPRFTVRRPILALHKLPISKNFYQTTLKAKLISFTNTRMKWVVTLLGTRRAAKLMLPLIGVAVSL